MDFLHICPNHQRLFTSVYLTKRAIQSFPMCHILFHITKSIASFILIIGTDLFQCDTYCIRCFPIFTSICALLNLHSIKMKLAFIPKSWMANGRVGRPAKNLLYKHSIAAYTNINGIAAYGVWIRIHHDNTMAELWQHWPKYHKSIMWYFCKSVKCKQNQESKK